MLFPEELGDDELKNLAGSSLNINPAALFTQVRHIRREQ